MKFTAVFATLALFVAHATAAPQLTRRDICLPPFRVSCPSGTIAGLTDTVTLLVGGRGPGGLFGEIINTIPDISIQAVRLAEDACGSVPFDIICCTERSPDSPMVCT